MKAKDIKKEILMSGWLKNSNCPLLIKKRPFIYELLQIKGPLFECPNRAAQYKFIMFKKNEKLFNDYSIDDVIMDTKPLLVQGTGKSYFPVELSWRNLEAAISDDAHLTATIGEDDTRRVMEHLATKTDLSDFDRIIQYAVIVLGHRPGSMGEGPLGDFYTMDYLFTQMTNLSQGIVPEEKGYRRSLYKKSGKPIVIRGMDDYFYDERDNLQEGEHFREQVLGLFNTSYQKVWRALFQELNTEVGVEFDITESEGGVLVASQQRPEFATSVYAVENYGKFSSEEIVMTLQKYESENTELIAKLADRLRSRKVKK